MTLSLKLELNSLNQNKENCLINKKIMKHLQLKKALFTLVALFMLSVAGTQAQVLTNTTNEYNATEIVKEKTETIQEKLGLTDDQMAKIQEIDKDIEAKLDAAADNTAAIKVYEEKEAAYKKVLSEEQFKKYIAEQEAIQAEAQQKWAEAHATQIGSKVTKVTKKTVIKQPAQPAE